MGSYFLPRYKVLRDADLCVQCGVCERSCANEVHRVDVDLGRVTANHTQCANCQRCVQMCPPHALAITSWPQVGNGTNNWSLNAIQEVEKQAESGGVLLSSMGNPQHYPAWQPNRELLYQWYYGAVYIPS